MQGFTKGQENINNIMFINTKIYLIMSFCITKFLDALHKFFIDEVLYFLTQDYIYFNLYNIV